MCCVFWLYSQPCHSQSKCLLPCHWQPVVVSVYQALFATVLLLALGFLNLKSKQQVLFFYVFPKTTVNLITLKINEQYLLCTNKYKKLHDDSIKVLNLQALMCYVWSISITYTYTCQELLSMANSHQHGSLYVKFPGASDLIIAHGLDSIRNPYNLIISKCKKC